MNDIHGKFYESDIFEKLYPQKIEKFNQEFQTMQKRYFSMQW